MIDKIKNNKKRIFKFILSLIISEIIENICLIFFPQFLPLCVAKSVALIATGIITIQVDKFLEKLI